MASGPTTASGGQLHLSGSVPAHDTYLIGGTVMASGSALPTPDVSFTLNMSGTAGRVVLYTGATTTTTIEGEPPKSRVVIQQWDSLEKVQAYRDSTAFKDLLPLRNKLAKFRSFVVEGVPL